MPMPIEGQARPTPILSALAGHTIQHEDGQKPRLQPFHPGRWPAKLCTIFRLHLPWGWMDSSRMLLMAYRRSNESNVWRGHSTHTGKTPQTFLHRERDIFDHFCNAKRRGFPAGFFSDHCNRFWQVEHAKFNMPREIGFWVQKSWKVIMRPRSSQLLTGSQAKSLGVRFAIWRGHDRTFSDSSSSPCDSTCADQDDHLSRDPRDFGMKNSAAFWWATHKGRNYQWIGLRENLQETIDFPIKYGVFL